VPVILTCCANFTERSPSPARFTGEIVVAGANLPGAEEVRSAPWIRAHANPTESSDQARTACAGLGAGERSAIFLAETSAADILIIDEALGRRAAKIVGIAVVGSIAILERGARLGKVPDLRTVYLELIRQRIHFDRGMLDNSLARLGQGKL
jgi:predicted nucleic acid-binding protein